MRMPTCSLECLTLTIDQGLTLDFTQYTSGMADFSALLADFDAAGDVYVRYADKLKGLVTEILAAEGINYHSVTSRPKSRVSLEKKILAADGKYQRLDEVTDCVGVRIITYFADDVDRAADLITKEFEIDIDNSVDKRDLLDPDRFGYLSLHYVASLPSTRANLVEYRRFVGMKAEVQIRSILQHAWAEIEHDLGYKTTLGVPRDIRRQFSRLAGLLELADSEFVQIRDHLAEYEATVAKRIQQAPAAVTLDKTSLTTFVMASDLVARLDQEIAATISVRIDDLSEWGMEKYATMLPAVGVNTIGHLQEVLESNGDAVVRLARGILAPSHGEKATLQSVVRGVSLLYLCYLLMLRRADDTTTNAIAEQLVGPESDKLDILARLRKAYAEMTNNVR
jgi:GTP pyrophosphokinase